MDHDITVGAEYNRKDEQGANELCIEFVEDVPLLVLWRPDVVDMRCAWGGQSLDGRLYNFGKGCRPVRELVSRESLGRI